MSPAATAPRCPACRDLRLAPGRPLCGACWTEVPMWLRKRVDAAWKATNTGSTKAEIAYQSLLQQAIKYARRTIR